MGSRFHKHIVVGDNTYFTDTKMGATLPAFKYEIEDFFFTRLGTGRTSQNRRATSVYADVYNGKIYRRRKYLRVIFFGKIFYKHNVVGNDTYFIDTKMGGRTSLFLTSQRMPSRYVLLLQVYRMVEFIGV